ncbi:hypothetical protein [Pseudomonas sp.]
MSVQARWLLMGLIMSVRAQSLLMAPIMSVPVRWLLMGLIVSVRAR